MLELKNIVKNYTAGDQEVPALRGVSLAFRKSEFVSILGPSGCGKTTLLNIIGGLDRYTSGDLIINSRSTKEYKDADWDTYRNHSIGFVFQSYNLIPHQTVLSNVELALTLSGVSKAERRRRAKEALEKVGLGDQLYKRPNQMSGGQMQRVAIARALVNDPDILLADEPTGALDTTTSEQIMDILKEISENRLIIMVTHNPELAEKYSTRIVKLLDGKVTDDSMPYSDEEIARDKKAEKKADTKVKKSMSFFTALSLSFNNLMTKRARTLLTAFAGSIGIIGIALILALSTGVNDYIGQVQEETLSSYPITLEAERVDMAAMMTSMMGANTSDSEADARDPDKIYSSTIMYEMMNSMMSAEVSTNDLKSFKAHLETDGRIEELATIRYGYDFDFDIYTKDEDGNILKSDVMAMLQNAMGSMFGGDYSSYFDTMGGMYEQMDVWQELMPGENGEPIAEQVMSQYDMLYGSWPANPDEVVLFVSETNEISDLMLYALGYISDEAMSESMNALMAGENVEIETLEWTYPELCETSFKLVLPAEYYQHDPLTGGYVDMSLTDAGMDYLYNSSDVGIPLKIVGIARPSEDATSASMASGAIGYISELTTLAITRTQEMDIVKEQMADEDMDVFTALPFATGDEVEPTAEEKTEAIIELLSSMSVADKAAAYTDIMCQPEDAYVDSIVEQQIGALTREDIENMIVQQYAAEMGVDAEVITGYIAEMTDAELFAQVEEAAAMQVREQYAAAVEQQMGALSADQLAGALDLILTGDEMTLQYANLAPFAEWQYVYLYDNYMPATVSEATYEENMDILGYVDLDDPATINLYASTFEDKDAIADLIGEYNAGVDEEAQIEYTDYIALLMSGITNIINAISYVLIAFVAISLVVSSIMIGIITYISVLERTKEIGVLRSIGASKHDVSLVFNAETLIVGLAAGLIGIGTSLLLCIPINLIVHHLTGIPTLSAFLMPEHCVILVCISMALTLIAGLFPAGIAARKDPVEALRTE